MMPCAASPHLPSYSSALSPLDGFSYVMRDRLFGLQNPLLLPVILVYIHIMHTLYIYVVDNIYLCSSSCLDVLCASERILYGPGYDGRAPKRAGHACKANLSSRCAVLIVLSIQLLIDSASSFV